METLLLAARTAGDVLDLLDAQALQLRSNRQPKIDVRLGHRVFSHDSRRAHGGDAVCNVLADLEAADTDAWAYRGDDFSASTEMVRRSFQDAGFDTPPPRVCRDDPAACLVGEENGDAIGDADAHRTLGLWLSRDCIGFLRTNQGEIAIVGDGKSRAVHLIHLINGLEWKRAIPSGEGV